MRGGDHPAGVLTLPELRLLAASAADELGDRDDQGVVVVDGLDVGLDDGPLRRPAAAGPERADLLVPDEQSLGVAAQGGRAGGEQPVERGGVVGHQRPLVGPEGVHQPGGRVVPHRRPFSTATKSLRRMRACTPLTRSTTWLMSKSVAADR